MKTFPRPIRTQKAELGIFTGTAILRGTAVLLLRMPTFENGGFCLILFRPRADIGKSLRSTIHSGFFCAALASFANSW